jgi:hypothetical protein
VLADAGYWHHVQMDTLVERGMQVLIPPDAGKRRGTRPGWDGRLSDVLCVRPGRLLSCQSGSRSPKWIFRARSALVQR